MKPSLLIVVFCAGMVAAAGIGSVVAYFNRPPANPALGMIQHMQHVFTSSPEYQACQQRLDSGAPDMLADLRQAQQTYGSGNMARNTVVDGCMAELNHLEQADADKAPQEQVDDIEEDMGIVCDPQRVGWHYGKSSSLALMCVLGAK